MRKIFLPILAFSCLSAQAQKSVSTNGQKKVLVEESTGAWCQYCPDGAVVLNNILASNPAAIGVSIHGGGGADQMKFADGNTVTSAYFTAFPLGMVDRFPTGSPAKPAQSRSMWSNMVSTRAAVAPDFDVIMDNAYNTTTRVLTVYVKGKALKAMTGNYNLNAFVIEDSVSGTGSGWDQVNYYNTQSGHPYFGAGNPIVGFQHMHVVRAMLGGAWGTTGKIPANPAINASGAVVYKYTLPAGADYKHFKVVGMVMKDNTADANDRAISNAAEAKVTPGTLSIGNGPAIEEVAVFPNPANNTVSISGTLPVASDLSITLLNQVGQTILTRDVKFNGAMSMNESIDVATIPNGIYFIQIVSEAGKTTQKLVINH